jgi:hypothetical protein
MFKEYETFLLKRLVAGLPVPVGTRGIVLVDYHANPPAYEVEFCEENGRNSIVATLTQDDMEKDPLSN